MTKMAAMPIYDKNTLKIFCSGTGGPILTKISMYQWGLLPIIILTNDEPRLTLTYSTS